MSYSIDVDGNDNTPEWGYCTEAGCKEPALPIWLYGGYPDDADLFLCMDHIGKLIAEQKEQIAALQESSAFRIGSAIINR